MVFFPTVFSKDLAGCVGHYFVEGVGQQVQAVYTIRNTIVSFTLHGLTKVTFYINHTEITKTYLYHCMDYPNIRPLTQCMG